jgi:hypothetical protein
MFKKALIIPFITLISISASSQILYLDREKGEDSVRKKINFTGDLTFSSDKQKNNILDLSAQLELDRFYQNKFCLISLFKNDATFLGKKTIQNEGFFHIRYRDQDTRRISAEEYLQYQWNGSWGMEYRILAGANMRNRWIDNSKFDVYTGIGLFQEWERWNWSGLSDNLNTPDKTPVNKTLCRLNSYAKISAKITENVDLALMSYLQFPVDEYFFKPRWNFESNVYFRAGKNFSFLIHWDHILDNNRVVPIQSFYYSISTGLQFNLSK